MAVLTLYPIARAQLQCSRQLDVAARRANWSSLEHRDVFITILTPMLHCSAGSSPSVTRKLNNYGAW